MEAKLTLKLDKYVIDSAKIYASTKKRSLSRIIESYLQSLMIQKDSNNQIDEFPISPFVKSMSSGINIPADLDYKSEFTSHLIEKYK